MSSPMRFKARMSAPLPEVRRALTEPAALRTWLAEHAEVDLPHRYAFWGRYTPEGDEPRQRPEHADDRSLRLAWRLSGEDTTVEMGLDEDTAGSTILTLSQSHIPDWSEMMTDTSVFGILHTFWALAVANLADYVEGRELTGRCDFSSPEMRAQVDIGAGPEAVYDSIVDAEKFSRWFGANIELEPYVGGRWAMGSLELDKTPAKIVELERGRRMSIAWDDMVASWELEGSEGRTRLTFVRSGFDQKDPPYGEWMGWLAGVAELRRFHEVPDWRPMWVEVDIAGAPDGLMATD